MRFEGLHREANHRHDFPDKQMATEVWTHDLGKLVRLAGVAPDLDRDMRTSPALQPNWTIVKDWSETLRYDLTITRSQATDFCSACTRRTNGVLPWIRKRW